jgi:hypothetical protein
VTSSEIEEIHKGNKTVFSKNILQKTRSFTEIELPGLKIEDVWQHPDSCEIFVLLKIRNTDISIVRIKAKIDNLLFIASEAKNSLSDRLSATDSALGLLKQTSFERLPNSDSVEAYQQKFEWMKTVINKHQENNRNAVYFLGNSIIVDSSRKDLMKLINQKIKGSFLAKDFCDTGKSCIMRSLESNIPYTTAIEVNMSPVNQSGFWVSIFSVSSSILSTESSELIYTSGVNSVKVMARQKFELTPKYAFDKWLKVHDSTISSKNVLTP